MKILRTFVIVIAILSCLMITVNAEILAPVEPPPAYIAGRYQALGSNNVGYTTYPADTQWYKVDALAGQVPFIAKWYSLLQEGHIYKVVIDVTEEPIFPGWEYIEGTGVLSPSEYLYVGSCGLDAFPNIDLSVSAYGTEQWLKQVDSSKIKKFDPSTYTFFVDKTNKYIAILFVATPENIADWVSSYLYISMGTMQYDSVGRWYAEFEPFELQDNADYKAILEEIKQILLESSEGGGSGLTEEQLNEVIQDALTAHDQHLQSDVQQQGTQADQLVDQLGDIVPAVKLQTALQGLTAAVSGNHRTCVLTLPEIIEPVTGAMIMEETPIDLTGTIQGIINGDPRIATLVNLIRWINLLVLAFLLLRSIMNIINYVTTGGDQGE